MTYNRPPGMKYTEMAMYFDAHIHDNPRNDDILYQYLYHIIYMLACKSRYFHKFAEYDSFALHAATRIYMRCINENSERITSILNYVKAVLYPIKVDYQRDEFNEIINPEIDKEINTDKITAIMEESIQADYRYDMREDIIRSFGNISKVIKDVLYQTPYRKDKLLIKKLYMSVLLSMLKSFTLSNNNIQKLQRKESRKQIKDAQIIAMLEHENSTCITTWHLDSKWNSYIRLLCNKVRKLMNEDIAGIKSSFELSSDDINAIIMSAYGSEGDHNNVDERD